MPPKMGSRGKKVTKLHKMHPRTIFAHPRSNSMRNLSKSDLGGVIFGCTQETMEECLREQLFGLPPSNFLYVKNIEPGLPLFLFNYTNKKLHGIYEAASRGQLNINPHAWTTNDAEITKYPAQVRFRIRTQCLPLTEKQFSEVIQDNYYNEKHFQYELDHAQTNGLIALFEPLCIPPRTTEISNLSRSKVPSPAPANADRTNTRAGEWKQVKMRTEKQSSMPSVGWENADKFASLLSGVGCSSKTSNNAHEEGETRDPALELGTDCAGQYVQDSGRLRKDFTISFNEIKFSERELKEPASYQEADCMEENMQGSPSGDASLHLDGESLSFFQQRSGTESSEMVLQNQQKQKVDCSSSKVFTDDSDMPSGVHKEIRLPREPFVLPEAANQTIVELSRDVHEENRLPDSFGITETEQNTTSSGSYHGNAELVEIINVLKYKTEKLEKKQAESDQEMHQLRNVVKESGKVIEELVDHVKGLESKLSINGITSKTFPTQYLGSEKLVYLIGGTNGSSFLALDSFSPSVDMVKPLKPMSGARLYASAAALNDNIYLFGGSDGTSNCDTVECYSPRDDVWTLSAPLSRPKTNLSGATLDGKIYAIGGGYEHECSSDVEVFNPALGRWNNIQPMHQKRFAPAATELNGVLYVVAGFDGICYLQSIERYDPRGGSWTSLRGMQMGRGGHSLAVLNDKIYVLGGHNGEKADSSVEIFDPRASAWMVGEPMNFARGYFSAAVVGDDVFVIGGVQDGHYLDIVECYKETTGWTVTGSKSVGARSYLSTIVL